MMDWKKTLTVTDAQGTCLRAFADLLGAGPEAWSRADPRTIPDAFAAIGAIALARDAAGTRSPDWSAESTTVEGVSLVRIRHPEAGEFTLMLDARMAISSASWTRTGKARAPELAGFRAEPDENGWKLSLDALPEPVTIRFAGPVPGLPWTGEPCFEAGASAKPPPAGPLVSPAALTTALPPPQQLSANVSGAGGRTVSPSENAPSWRSSALADPGHTVSRASCGAPRRRALPETAEQSENNKKQGVSKSSIDTAFATHRELLPPSPAAAPPAAPDPRVIAAVAEIAARFSDPSVAGLGKAIGGTVLLAIPVYVVILNLAGPDLAPLLGMAAIVALLGGMVLRAGREGRRQITGNKARLLEEIAARFPSPSERAAALDALRDLPNPDADPVLHELQNALKAGTQLQASEGGRETSQEIFPKR